MEKSQKELFSEKISAGSRTYFFDIKMSKQLDKYLVISESQKREEGVFDHHRIMVFEEHLLDFYKGLRKAISYFIEHDDLSKSEDKKAYSVDVIRTEYPKAYAKWTEEDDDLFRRLHKEGKSINEIAQQLQRKEGAIRIRLIKKGLA
ncbi:MAG TPA: DUF3276 family protein [bacterium]|nr:DUF3276 family protein [bacterium]